MIFDTEEQKVMLMQIIDGVGFSGKDVEKIYELKQAIKGAQIAGEIAPAKE